MPEIPGSRYNLSASALAPVDRRSRSGRVVEPTCMSPDIPHSLSESPAPARTPRGGRWWRVAGVLTLALCGTGCVHRRMVIHSDPPGALVLLEGEEIGYTPCAVDFTHYGTREITLVKDGYETLSVLQKFRTPWYQVTPVDFVTDNFLMAHATDRQGFTYRLRRQEIVPTNELLDRASDLRSTAQSGGR